METSLGFRHKHRLPTRPAHAPLRSTNRRLLPHGHGDRAMRRADLSMRRACAHLRFAICNRGYGGQRSIFVCLAPSNPMAASGDRSRGLTKEASAEEGVRREQEEAEAGKKPSALAPAPPEMPAPGDCCGSGCVRCVWDVYYEELEAYNNSLRRDEGSGSDSNPS